MSDLLATTPHAVRWAQRDIRSRVMPLPIGTKTQWGTIEMVGFTGGERYYWMVNRVGSKSAGVAMIPAFMVEAAHNADVTGLAPGKDDK